MKHRRQPLITFLRSHAKTRRLVYIVIGFIAIYVLSPLWYQVAFPPVRDPLYGTSFSVKRARELGIDWHANFTALLDDMQLRHFRLMSYWDESEKTRGQLDFTDLDWQVNEAAKRGATVSLAIGVRQPRWPECHQPTWAKSLSGNTWKQALYAYMEIVVKRYQGNPAVESFQLENEALTEWFGKCDTPDPTRINEEFTLVKSWTTKPLLMSLSDQHGLPINPPVPDAYGYSVYRIVWNDKTPPFAGYIVYPTPIWYHRARASVIKLMTGRDVFIHELQLEPWGPQDTVDLPIAEQDKSMNAAQIASNIHFAREIGAQTIDTWGSEWWYWRKINGDPRIWEAVKEEFRTQR